MTYWPHSDPNPEPTFAPETTRENDRLAVETLRTVIGSGLAKLEELMPHVEQLILTHQRGIGFMTVEAKAMQDEMLRKERAARFPKITGPLGTASFTRPTSVIAASGERPAPGNISAYSIRAEVAMRLGEVIHYLTRKLRDAGVCMVDGVPREPTFAQLVETLLSLSGVLANVRTLEWVSQEIEQLVSKATRLVDGDDKKQHPKPCPHCGRMTLVIYISQGKIVCEKDPETGQFETCICNDANSPYCPCRRNRAHRHEWSRQPATKRDRDWWHLKDAQALAERRETEGAQA